MICDCSDCFLTTETHTYIILIGPITFLIHPNDISSESARHAINKMWIWMTAPAIIKLLTQDLKHLHLNLEPLKGQGQLHNALSMKLGTQTFKMVLSRRHWTCSAYDKNHGTGTPGGIESSERVIHANRVCCCELFYARSSLIVPPLDSSHSSHKLPITKPSFVTNSSCHQSATYFTLSTSAASSK